MSVDGRKLAVLIDAENISSKYIKIIIDEATNNGNIILKRIYGDWTNNAMAPWKNVILDNSIQPIQQYRYTGSKNSSDSSMIIDAMDLMYSGRLEGFCLVSSDSDFTRLAARLRENELFVIGMGEKKTPKSFINACDKFVTLDALYSESKTVDDAAAGAQVEKPEKQPKNEKATAAGEASKETKKTAQRMKTIIEENSDDDGWINSSMVLSHMQKRYPDFDFRNYGFKKFNLFIESLGIFEVRRNPGGEVKVRNRDTKK